MLANYWTPRGSLFSLLADRSTRVPLFCCRAARQDFPRRKRPPGAEVRQTVAYAPTLLKERANYPMFQHCVPFCAERAHPQRPLQLQHHRQALLPRRQEPQQGLRRLWRPPMRQRPRRHRQRRLQRTHPPPLRAPRRLKRSAGMGLQTTCHAGLMRLYPRLPIALLVAP